MSVGGDGDAGDVVLKDVDADAGVVEGGAGLEGRGVAEPVGVEVGLGEDVLDVGAEVGGAG